MHRVLVWLFASVLMPGWVQTVTAQPKGDVVYALGLDFGHLDFSIILIQGRRAYIAPGKMNYILKNR